MSKRKILYSIVSVGLGNLSRTLAILEELPSDKYEIRFIAQGKVYEYLKSRFQTYQFEEIVYSSGKFDLISVLKKNYLFPLKYLRNVKKAFKIIDDYKPDALIVDSDFFCFYPARKRRIPIISLNSSLATVTKFIQFRSSIFDKFFSYFFIEKVDAFLQKKFPDLIICPVISKLENSPSKFHQVNPIVRRQFIGTGDRRYTSVPDSQVYDIAVMLGGSVIGMGNIDLSGYKGKCLIIGQKKGINGPPNTHHIEFTEEPAKYLSQAKIIIVQGGFNSISEVIALGKPAVFVPIKGHCEQFVNAKWAEELGIGIVAEGNNVIKAISELEENYSRYFNNCKQNATVCNGAIESAHILQEFIDA